MDSERFHLVDDGTLDTVLQDGESGLEYRYTYDGLIECDAHGLWCESERCAEADYEAWLEWAMEDASERVEQDVEAIASINASLKALTPTQAMPIA